MRHLGCTLAIGLFATMIGCSMDESGTGNAAAGSANGGSAGTHAGGSSGAGVGGKSGSGGSSGGGGTVDGGSGTGGAPAVPGLRFVGRTDESEAGVVKLSWSGSAINFRFKGTDASVRMDDSARFFSVLVDGALQTPLATSGGEQLYPVATGLSEVEHEVWLFRRTEGSFGATRFIGVELGSGTLLAPTPPSARRMEVIGDSITAGYGDEGADQYCDFSADTENHYITYGAITARNLGAELVTIAWSGKGIVYNYGVDTAEPMPDLYDRAIATDAASSWDFSAWQPQVVVINLGTNDFSTDNDPSASLFTQAYQTFLEHLRSKNPDAYLLCLIPTLLGGSDLTAAQTYIENAVAARNSAGDTKLEAYVLEFQQIGWGCDWHPSAQTHASMAAALTTKLKSLLGW